MTTSLILLLGAAIAVGGAKPSDSVDYVRDVKSVLRDRCYACHGVLKQEGGLRVDTAAALRTGGDSGTALQADDGEPSLILQRITSEDEDERMPPEGKPLSADQIAHLTAWIDRGASAPADEAPQEDPQLHWAFQRPTRPEVPLLKRPNGNLVNPIDAFIAWEHEKHGLDPLPAADRHVLLRRLYLDLIGLPPTREELRDFRADDSIDAYERVVDRLLRSPAYGERWGRHWMDVWRYSDWYGRRSVPDVLNSYAQIWRWRDWIVRSLNEDKGYDRMILEMLAADEVTPCDQDNVVATGFIVRNFYRWNYNTWMKDSIEHTGKAFLGLTLNCCQCHDHKYDPITQEEYFGFRAFFEPIELRQDRVPGEPDPGPYPKYDYGKAYKPIQSGLIRVVDEKLDAETFLYTGGEARNVVPGKPPVPPGAPALLGGDRMKIEPVELPPAAWYPGLTPFVREEEVAKREAAIQDTDAKLIEARKRRTESLPDLQAKVRQADVQRAEMVRKHGARMGKSQALAGARSLVLQAGTGRRALANPLDGLAVVDDDTAVWFRLKILEDGNANFQLALDLGKGLTGAYIAFEKGRIVTYRPGGFETFEAGKYDLSAGQNHFAVRLDLQPSKDRLALTVESLSDGARLVDGVPAALNGWNPVGKAGQGIFLDAKAGAQVAFDKIVVAQRGAKPQARFDFEGSAYTDEGDVVGIDGWIASSFGAAPATSRASSMTQAPAEVRQAEQRQRIARRNVDAIELSVVAAQASLDAAQAELTSLRARISADDARYLESSADPEPLTRKAVRVEREAALAAAQANSAAANAALAEAQGKPLTDAKRDAAIEAADKQSAAVASKLAAARKALDAKPTDYTPLTPQYPKKSTGRRTALAKWLGDEENPLTARVAVNHLWLRHFGRALVETTYDFGRSGAEPTHPELLDWLAVELMENGWRMKRLHRLIVTSDAYRRRSNLGGPDHPNRAIDRDNRFLWRFEPRRMEAEVVRDAMLHVAGELDATIGGKEIDHKQGLDVRRRSIYFAHHGESRMQFLEQFDPANACDCYRRTSSVLPQQALALSNSRLPLNMGRLLARKLWDSVGGTSDGANDATGFVDAAFEQILAREPSEAERRATLEFLQRQESLFASAPSEQLGAAPADQEVAPAVEPAARARENLVQALFNHNDFVTVR